MNGWLVLAADEINGVTDMLSQSQELWNNALEFLTKSGVTLGINLIAALVIFVIGRFVAKMLKNLSKRLMKKSKIDDTLSIFLSNIVYAMLLTFVILASIDRLGVNTTSFSAIIASAGLAVGFALQGSLANFAAGVMLILFRPFRVGDFIDAGGTAGVVEEIHIFSTLMRTGDNIAIVIPNNQITSGVIKNFSLKPTRRIDLVIGCAYDDDLRGVKAFLESVIDEDERILYDPAPVVAVSELGDSSVNFVVRPWVANADYWAVRWDMTEKIKLGFDEKGFNFPFPSRDLYINSGSDFVSNNDAA